jgi:hypothetical protein
MLSPLLSSPLYYNAATIPATIAASPPMLASRVGAPAFELEVVAAVPDPDFVAEPPAPPVLEPAAVGLALVDKAVLLPVGLAAVPFPAVVPAGVLAGVVAFPPGAVAEAVAAE